MSSGFVPAGTVLPAPPSPPSATDASWAAARAAVAGTGTTQAPAQSQPPADSRSLFEILAANKARKQEEFEEKLKFKNQFRALDEDDVDFLDSVAEKERAAEKLRRAEVEGEVERFRNLQREEGGGEGEDAAGEVWGKRKRSGGRKRGIVGVKKGESAAAEPAEAEEVVKKRKVEEPRDAQPKAAAEKVGSIDAEKVGKKAVSAEEKTPKISPAPKAAPKAAMALVDYGSDDDDD